MSDQRKGPGCSSWIVYVLMAVVGWYAWQWWAGSPPSLSQFVVPLSSAPSPDFRVTGAPSISVAQIEQVLAWCHSPAQGQGQALYDGGVASEIDPVFPLAWFLHESTCGNAGMARRTHSLGNIICTEGYACIGRFRAYTSWAASFEDWYRLIKREYLPRGLVTVDQIVPVYAPAEDNNNVRAYICAIKQAVITWRAGKVAVTGKGGC